MEKVKEGFLNFFADNGVNILVSIAILLIGILLAKMLVGVLKKILKRSRLDPLCHKFILSFTHITLYIIIVIAACTKLGIPMTSLVTILGAASLAIGLAVQDSLSNLAGGFILLFSKPFQVGDYVEIATIGGTVKHINILQTKLDTPDNKAIYIPNGQVASAKIINYSHEATRRLDLIFSIGYHDDFEKAKKIISEIVDKNPLALKDPAPIIRVCAHSQNSIDIAAKVWVLTENYIDLNFDMLENVKTAFDKNNIVIPYNKLDVYVKHDDLTE